MQKVTKGVMKKKFATLVLSMLKIGCIGFGGGSALIPVLQKEAVQDKGLITEDELDSDIVAASITPGALPVEIAAGIGKTTCGTAGMFAAASAMALPGAMLTTLFLMFATMVGEKLTTQMCYASVGITAYIIVILGQYILTTLKKAKNNRGGMILAAIVILLVWMFNGEDNFFRLCGITDTPIFGVSTIEIFIVAFFVIICNGGRFKSWWTVIAGVISLIFLFSTGDSHLIGSSTFTKGLMLGMLVLGLVRLVMNFRSKESFHIGEWKEIIVEVLLWIGFLVVLSLPAWIMMPKSLTFTGQGLLSAIMSFGGGDAYLSVAQGLFVDSGMITADEFYGGVVTMANILPGSILCKVLSGIGYLWGVDQTGTVWGGIVAALAGFASATGMSCAVFGIAKIVYDKWRKMEMIQALNHLIRPIVSGLLISVGISLYGTNCVVEDNAGWGYGSIAFLMIVIVCGVCVMQRKKIHMIWQVLMSIGVSLMACNLFNVIY